MLARCGYLILLSACLLAHGDVVDQGAASAASDENQERPPLLQQPLHRLRPTQLSPKPFNQKPRPPAPTQSAESSELIEHCPHSESKWTRSRTTSRSSSGKRLWRRMVNIANGGLLLTAAPLALRGSLWGFALFRDALLCVWLSAFGGILILSEIQLPWVKRWLRKHLRIMTSCSGRTVLLLCAASVALASGPFAALPAALTAANALLGPNRRCDATPRKKRQRKRPVHQAIANG